MKTGNVVVEKSYDFALRIVSMRRIMREEWREYDMARQLLRSGTSIGANVEEAVGGQSKRDFLAKMQIAYKEARETHYWLRLIRDSGQTTAGRMSPLLEACEELIRLTGSICITTRRSLHDTSHPIPPRQNS